MENTIKSNSLRYFVYCRKSSDSEDKQIASLPEQIKELTEKAIKENLQVVDILQESRSAFHTGRPKFEEMYPYTVDRVDDKVFISFRYSYYGFKGYEKKYPIIGYCDLKTGKLTMNKDNC